MACGYAVTSVGWQLAMARSLSPRCLALAVRRRGVSIRSNIRDARTTRHPHRPDPTFGPAVERWWLDEWTRPGGLYCIQLLDEEQGRRYDGETLPALPISSVGSMLSQSADSQGRGHHIDILHVSTGGQTLPPSESTYHSSTHESPYLSTETG